MKTIILFYSSARHMCVCFSGILKSDFMWLAVCSFSLSLFLIFLMTWRNNVVFSFSNSLHSLLFSSARFETTIEPLFLALALSLSLSMAPFYAQKRVCFVWPFASEQESCCGGVYIYIYIFIRIDNSRLSMHKAQKECCLKRRNEWVVLAKQ